VVTLGTGACKITSTKHNIVTKSSTEAEVVGVSDGIGDNDVRPLILYQYSTSAITLMENTKELSILLFDFFC